MGKKCVSANNDVKIILFLWHYYYISFSKACGKYKCEACS